MNHKLKKACLISLIMLTSLNSFAQQESVYLDKGTPAPFFGYLLPEDTVITLRNNTLERDMYKTESTLKDQQIQLLSTQNDNLSKTLESTSSLNAWEKIGFFVGGVLITGLAISGAHAIYH